MRGISGLAAARKLLEPHGLSNVGIAETPGQLTDHYDPRSKTLRLSQGVYGSESVAALGIVAHKVGHAVPESAGYLPPRFGNGLVAFANLGSNLAVLNGAALTHVAALLQSAGQLAYFLFAALGMGRSSED